MTFTRLITGLFLTAVILCLGMPSMAASLDDSKKDVMTVALNTHLPKSKYVLKRYPTPGYSGKHLAEFHYKGLTLIGAPVTDKAASSNIAYFRKIRNAIDLIEARTPEIFNLMMNVNKKGRRVIHYTGTIGPASFAAWKKDYVVNITASNIDDDPVFENSVYSLAATLVHELLGHGRQQEDGRVWAMYDWCGKDSKDVKGVVRQINHKGSNSGLVEYEANLFAKWFLESVRGEYPNLIEPAVRRYVRLVKNIKNRFPGWYDDQKPATALLIEFKDRFADVCPKLKFTPHPVHTP